MSLNEDTETGLLKGLVCEGGLNSSEKHVFVSVEGKRLNNLSFDYAESFSEGLAAAAVCGRGYGFVDRDMNFVIPMKYNRAEEFKSSSAIVQLDEKWLRLDKAGRETELDTMDVYEEVGSYHEGMCRVSTLALDQASLAYHSDWEYIAGTWGFVDEDGVEVIPPQYIYANDFKNGMAIVAKGEWKVCPEFGNRYWTEDELWGAIDRNGNEVIPFVFDEIKTFEDRSDIFMAHSGGWENGSWGVIDSRGNWLAEPMFWGIDYSTGGDLILFYAEYTGSTELIGIYDLAKKEVLFEPQFVDASFMDDGSIMVESLDTKLGRRIGKIIDSSGKERFHSAYSHIHTWTYPYVSDLCGENGTVRGLIDKDGNVILPCKYNAAVNGFKLDKKVIIFEENEKQGMMDFDGNVIVLAVYQQILCNDSPFIHVIMGNSCDGIINCEGAQVLPPRFKYISWHSDGKHFFCRADDHCEMYAIEQIPAPPSQ